MQEKQKVTLYFPPDLHRQLKIQAAIADEPMSSLAQKAIGFYLTHPQVVEQIEAVHGQTHQVHHCPACEAAVVLRDGALVGIVAQPAILPEIAEELIMANAEQGVIALIPC
jgi:hypothetical protein